MQPQDFFDAFINIQKDLLKYGGLLNVYDRTTNLSIINENELEVKTITMLEYSYLSEKHRYFGRQFFASKK